MKTELSAGIPFMLHRLKSEVGGKMILHAGKGRHLPQFHVSGESVGQERVNRK
jgi:hypothetical protein